MALLTALDKKVVTEPEFYRHDLLALRNLVTRGNISPKNCPKGLVANIRTQNGGKGLTG